MPFVQPGPQCLRSETCLVNGWVDGWEESFVYICVSTRITPKNFKLFKLFRQNEFHIINVLINLKRTTFSLVYEDNNLGIFSNSFPFIYHPIDCQILEARKITTTSTFPCPPTPLEFQEALYKWIPREVEKPLIITSLNEFHELKPECMQVDEYLTI